MRPFSIWLDEGMGIPNGNLAGDESLGAWKPVSAVELKKAARIPFAQWIQRPI
jgi:hypothetical protein